MKKYPEVRGVPFRTAVELGIPSHDECQALAQELGWIDPHTSALTTEIGIAAYRIVGSDTAGDLEYLLGPEVARQAQARRLLRARLLSVLNPAAEKLEGIRSDQRYRALISAAQALLRGESVEDDEFPNSLPAIQPQRLE